MANQIEKRLTELEHRVAVLEAATTPEPARTSPQQKTVSPKEFLIQHRPTTDVHTTFLLATFAERILAMPSFNTDDLRQLFGAARVPLPKNLNDAINKNIRKGLITEATERKNDKKAWVITISGEQAFDEGTNI